jgi:hypothetical protein
MRQVLPRNPGPPLLIARMSSHHAYAALNRLPHNSRLPHRAIPSMAVAAIRNASPTVPESQSAPPQPRASIHGTRFGPFLPNRAPPSMTVTSALPSMEARPHSRLHLPPSLSLNRPDPDTQARAWRRDGCNLQDDSGERLTSVVAGCFAHHLVLIFYSAPSLVTGSMAWIENDRAPWRHPTSAELHPQQIRVASPPVPVSRPGRADRQELRPRR